MKRVIFPVILLSLSLNLFAVDKTTLKTVVIDAGHGGKDPGALGSIIQEKEVTLNVAVKLGEIIAKNNPEVKVVYTRNTDVFIPLDERANIANKNKADLFISIHANTISTPSTKGTETFVLGLHRSLDNLEVAKKENSVIVMEDNYTTKYEGFDPNLSESYIIFELIQNVYLDQSIAMATSVQKELSSQSHRNDRGVKQAGFLVLRQTSMPSILIEVGFLSNKEEEKYIASSLGQEEIAQSIYRSFFGYKSKFEAKSTIQKADKPEVKDVAEKHTVVKNSIVYKVQIASSPKKIGNKTSPVSKFSDVAFYKEDEKFKYTVYETNDVEEIKEFLDKAKKIVKDAFIVAFDKDGKKLSNSQVKKLLEGNRSSR